MQYVTFFSCCVFGDAGLGNGIHQFRASPRLQNQAAGLCHSSNLAIPLSFVREWSEE